MIKADSDIYVDLHIVCLCGCMPARLFVQANRSVIGMNYTKLLQVVSGYVKFGITYFLFSFFYLSIFSVMLIAIVICKCYLS